VGLSEGIESTCTLHLAGEALNQIVKARPARGSGRLLARK